MHDRLGMEAIRSLHQQLDDDENGNIDLTESDDVSNTMNQIWSNENKKIVDATIYARGDCWVSCLHAFKRFITHFICCV